MEDFATLLEENLKKRKRIEPGSLHKAKIIRDSKDYFFIRTNEEKIEGIVSKEEFQEGDIPSINSELDVYFLEEISGDYLFTHCLVDDAITLSRLDLSMERDLPIWGVVSLKQANGYLVKLGDIQAFCPFSQFEPQYKGEDLVGKKFRFVVILNDNKKLQVSQRKISDKEKEARTEILKSEWKEASFVTAVISSIQDKGLQVNVEGLGGFVPISEASFKTDPQLDKEFRIGQSLQAKILELDWSRNRILLSVKDFLNDPWASKLPFKEGEIREGIVDRVKNFGVFVRLNDEFTGLVPNRELPSARKGSYAPDLTPGSKVKVFIMELNPEKRQISLSINRAQETEDRMEYQKYLVSEEEASSTSSFGLLLKKSLEGKGKK